MASDVPRNRITSEHEVNSWSQIVRHRMFIGSPTRYIISLRDGDHHNKPISTFVHAGSGLQNVNGSYTLSKSHLQSHIRGICTICRPHECGMQIFRRFRCTPLVVAVATNSLRHHCGLFERDVSSIPYCRLTRERNTSNLLNRRSP